jgi:hypothetical protein
VGAGKDLLERVARCVLDATENPLGDGAKFPKLVHEAQRALERAADKDISTSDEVRVIAGAAQNIATNVNTIRNRVGTGHGRARVAKTPFAGCPRCFASVAPSRGSWDAGTGELEEMQSGGEARRYASSSP